MKESSDENKREEFSIWLWKKMNAPFLERLEFMITWIIPRVLILALAYGFLHFLGKFFKFMTG